MNTGLATTINQKGFINKKTQAEMVAAKGAPKKEKLGGVIYWMIGGLALAKDFLVDPISDFIVSAGIGISATVVGAVVGLPLAAIALIVKIAYAASFFFIAFLYFSANGGVSSTIKIYRFALQTFGGIMEATPVLSLLPWAATMFFLIAFLENKIRSGGTMGKMTGMLIEKRAQ